MAKTRSHPPRTLTELPSEILGQIFLHVTPVGYVFEIASPTSLPSSTDLGHGVRRPFAPGTPLFTSRESRPHNPTPVFKLNIRSLLLIHPDVLPHVLEQVYANNIFYFRDLPTVRYFVQRISPLAISHIRSIQIDVRGPAKKVMRASFEYYFWDHPANDEVISILGCFPSLRELRLGGIGPGVMKRRAFTYRGRRWDRNFLDHQRWRVDNITLVAKIVGMDLSQYDTKAPTEEMPSLQNDEYQTNCNPFESGRVICADPGDPEKRYAAQGWCQLHGTRILKQDADVVLGSLEREVLDVAAAIEQARQFERELEDPQLRGDTN